MTNPDVPVPDVPVPDVNDPHIPDEEKIPEAPQPSPRREIFMQVTENRAADNYEGGTVIFGAVRGQRTDEIVDSRLVISAKRNELLHQYPWKYQSSKARRWYRITIDEVDLADVPPDPNDLARVAAEQARIAQEVQMATRPVAPAQVPDPDPSGT